MVDVGWPGDAVGFGGPMPGGGCRVEAALGLIADDLVSGGQVLEASLARALVLISNLGSCQDGGAGGADRRGGAAGCSSGHATHQMGCGGRALNWGRVAASLDFDDFSVANQRAFLALMEAFQHGGSGGFPLEAVLGSVWKNAEAQVEFLRHAVAAPSRLFQFRPDQAVLPVGGRGGGRGADGADGQAWVSLDLLETLYMLAKGGHEVGVRQVLDHLVRHCKEVLLVALDRMGVPECAIFQEAYRNLVEHFLRQAVCSSDCNPEEVCSMVKNMVMESAMSEQGLCDGSGSQSKATVLDARQSGLAQCSVAKSLSMQSVTQESSLVGMSNPWLGSSKSDSWADAMPVGGAKAAVVNGMDSIDSTKACATNIPLNPSPALPDIDSAKSGNGLQTRRTRASLAVGLSEGQQWGGTLSSDHHPPSRTLSTFFQHSTQPSPEVQVLLAAILDDFYVSHSLEERIRSSVHGEDLSWLGDSLLCRCLTTMEHPHEGCLARVDALPELRECMVKSACHCIRKLVHSKRIKSDAGDQELLRRLGSWLGRLTLARNRPIRLRDLDLKTVIKTAQQEDSLPAVLPFLLALLKATRGSPIFNKENPWIKAILVELAEVHMSEPLIARPEIDCILGVFDADLPVLIQRGYGSPYRARQPAVGALSAPVSNFYQNRDDSQVLQEQARLSQHRIPRHQVPALQLHGIQQRCHVVNSRSTAPLPLRGLASQAPISSSLQPGWNPLSRADQSCTKGTPQCLTSQGQPAPRQWSSSAGMTGQVLTDKRLCQPTIRGSQAGRRAPPAKRRNIERPEWGKPCSGRTANTHRTPGPIQRGWRRPVLNDDSGNLRSIACSRQKGRLERDKCASGLMNLAESEAREGFDSTTVVRRTARLQPQESGGCQREQELEQDSQAIGMTIGYKRDNKHTKDKTNSRNSNTSKTSHCKNGGLHVDSKFRSDIQACEKCGNGRSAGRCKDNNFAGRCGHAPGLVAIQQHQCRHGGCLQQGSGHRTSGCKRQTESRSPGSSPKGRRQRATGMTDPAGLARVVAVPCRNAQLRGRKADELDVWPGSHQVVDGLKSGISGRKAGSVMGRRGLAAGRGCAQGTHCTSRAGASPQVVCKAPERRNATSSPRSRPNGNARCSRMARSERGAQRSWGENGRKANALHGSVMQQANKGLCRHAHGSASDAKIGTCARQRAEKGNGDIADERRHAKRNKKMSGGGRPYQQMQPKADRARHPTLDMSAISA
ncbi:unnamed protein product [Ostreobium quekettii]|uniref:CCR4-NOT transcription complex subunit 1 CAF1-binding domain-containing protein n=1 Tax=Ostreobium quekettii TaxID=121088 RepID=A0A8S1JCZ7_9CHLO|nr:unnamed protein product [Ostreobium quekettii]